MTTPVRTIDTPSGPGTVDLAGPDEPRGLLLLTHGAGGSVQTADLLAIRDALVEAGMSVGLVTQPYRVAGRRTPPKPEVQDAAWTHLVHAVVGATAPGLPLVLGGRSNGARVACRTATACGAVAVLALAFPVHPPGRPETSRLPELDAVGVPTLVIQGERDPFGMPPPGESREVLVVPGDHALRRDVAAVAAAASIFVTSTVARAWVER